MSGCPGASAHPVPLGKIVSEPGAEFPRFDVLGVHLTGARMDDVVARLVRAVADDERLSVNVFAVGSILECIDRPGLADVVNRADMILTDGMPLVWIGRARAKLDINRCYGPDVMIKTIAAGMGRGVSHYFYGGASDDVLQRLGGNLRRKFPGIRIAGMYSPPFRELTDEEKARDAERVNESGADIVWVGIGTPKQDFWVGEFRGRLSAKVIVAVGAAFSFHAGTVKQAPVWMRRTGLEWLFRLAAEPRRLWRRYLVGNPRFLLLAFRQLLRG